MSPEIPIPEDGSPIEIDVWRGNLIESRHRVHGAVVDAHGGVVLAFGDYNAPIYGRSAIKPLLALLLVESGAADRYNLTDREIALASASHSGEPGHVDAVKSWLGGVGLTIDDLECGPQAPGTEAALREMYAAGAMPTRAHNNCSGKHSGFLTAARHLGFPTKGYIQYEHPVQQRLLGILEQMSGTELTGVPRGIDGCGIPTIAFPIANHAFAMAQMADPHHLPEARAAACHRILRAMTREPWYVAGTGRFCTKVMEAASGKVAVKGGAEGVQMGALPEQGLGICLKASDGAGRAAEVAMGAVLRRIGVVDDSVAPQLGSVFEPEIRNWAGTVTGRIAPGSEARF
ncbi:MAG TPA: asparaginase [Candidatus Cybelea sp.]|nr:asparaginase [Candidatus Cybelea sp.]